MSDATLRRVADGLRHDGFKLEIRASGPTFRGDVNLRGTSITIRLEYSTTAFTEPPRVVVETPDKLPGGVIAHLDEANELCVLDRRVYVADRYFVAEQARGIVRKTAEVLERGLTAAGPSEIAHEFPRHWGGSSFRVDFAPFTGFARPKARKHVAEFERCGRSDAVAAVLCTARSLSFQHGQSRPSTLSDVLEWATSIDPDLSTQILSSMIALGAGDRVAIICASNGIIGFQLKLSDRGVNFAKTIRTDSVWRTLLSGQFGARLAVERLQGVRVDTDYLLGTNSMTGVAPLAGKHILQVGCGAIGGFLSYALAQFGAGLNGGSLTLIDHEQLEHRNLARHRLGETNVGVNKALACKQCIDAAIPNLAVSALPLRAEQSEHRIIASDLAIDATGEQAVGELLNAWRLKRTATGDPAFALLHTWIEGNGAAARSYFSSDINFGCYRCLQPDLSKPARFPALRADAHEAVSTGCGEAPFSPYGPAAPMAAAALTADHAVNWSVRSPRPLLRTIRLSYEDTLDRKPNNPTKSEHCPACGSH